MTILGVDGGATKTHAQIADENLKVLGEGFSSGSNYRHSSPQTATLRIKEAVEEAQTNASLRNTKMDSSCLGLAGLDTKEDSEVMEKAVAEILGPLFKKPPLIINDVQIAFASGTDSNFGIVLICGTGSHLLGKNQEGEEVQVSGLGRILSDQGSAYEMGSKALKIATKSYDGRSEKTLLEGLIVQKLGVSNMREAKNVVRSQNFGKSQIAELAKLVSEAEKKNDWAAEQIITETAEELTQIVYAAVKRLKMEKLKFDLVLSGSVIQNVTTVREKFETHVKKFAEGVNFIIPKHPPVFGALKLAKKRVGV